MAIEPVTHLERYIAGTVEPVTHLEKVIKQYGGGGGGGGSVTPTSVLTALKGMNSEQQSDARSAIGATDAMTSIPDDVKTALLACFENCAWKNGDGKEYIEVLEEALYPPGTVESITAVYTQSGIVRESTPLNDLKPDLIVTAHFDDGTDKVVTDYTLSGTLTEGASTVTVAYAEKTTTFTVTVSGWILEFAPPEIVVGQISNTSPYHGTLAGRGSYVGFEFETESGYVYKASSLVGSDGKTLQIAVFKLNAENVAKAKNGENVLYQDSGYQSEGYEFTADDGGCVWFMLKYPNAENVVGDDLPIVTFTREAAS